MVMLRRGGGEGVEEKEKIVKDRRLRVYEPFFTTMNVFMS